MANGHGGKRIGAGRKPGSKSKLDLRLQERLKEANADPVDALVDILKAEGDDHRLKIEAAKALMPYAYPRLSTQEIGISTDDLPDVTLELVMPKKGTDKPKKGTEGEG